MKNGTSGSVTPSGIDRRQRWNAALRRRVIFATVGTTAAIGALLVLRALGSRGLFNLAYAESIVPNLFQGARQTMVFTAVVIPTGLVVGFFVGWARTTRNWFLRALGSTYVEFFRSMPPLVLIAFAALISFVIVRRFLPVLDPFDAGLSAGTLALALHSSSYQSEIIRAGILSVPTGQSEAAEAVGLRKSQVMFAITLPQAFRVSLPALGNEFASVIKDTSLLSAISATELSFRGASLVSSSIFVDFNLVFIIWSEIAIIYFAITFIVTRVVRAVENRFKVPGLEAAQL